MAKVNQDTYAVVLKALLEDTHSAHDLAELSGLLPRTAQSLMHALRKKKAVHIVAWDVDALGRDRTPVYKLGEGKDKPKRTKISSAASAVKHRNRKRMLALVNAVSPNHHKEK